jgi:hypothetical protein
LAAACTAGVGDPVDEDTVSDVSVNELGEACSDQTLTVVPQGNELRFGIAQPVNGQIRNEPVALNPAIPVQRICDALIRKRDGLRQKDPVALASAEQCVQICDDAQALVRQSPVRGFKGTDPAKQKAMGEVADAFNAALGNDTNFSDVAGQAGANGESGAAVSCNAPVLQVIVSGRTESAEQRFGVDGNQVALNPNIPMENICQNRVASECRDRCRAAQAAVVASTVRGQSGALNRDNLRKMGEQADNFNRALGNATNFAASPIFKNFTDTGAAANNGADVGGRVACNAPLLQVIVSGSTSRAEQRFGVDGNQVALNPSIPINNICQNRVAAGCRDLCRAAQAEVAASGVRGQSGALNSDNLRKMGEQADNFNRAVGNTSKFADNPIFKNFTN